MSSNTLVFDISSDDDDALSAWKDSKGERYDWLSEVLDAVDQKLDDPDEVNPNKRLKLGNCTLRKVVDGDGDDDDGCVILEGDPESDKALSEDNIDSKQDSDELVIVGQKGQIACRDFPHPRHDCGTFPFRSTSHEQHCEQCHCYVCDTRAPCPYWYSGNSIIDHCHATAKDEVWNNMRTSFRLGTLPVTKAPAVTCTVVPQVNQAQQRSVPQSQWGTLPQLNQAPPTVSQAPLTPQRPRRTVPQVNQAPRRAMSQVNQASRTIPQAPRTLPRTVPQVNQAPPRTMPQVNQTPRRAVPQLNQAHVQYLKLHEQCLKLLTMPQVNQAPGTVPQVNQALLSRTVSQVNQALWLTISQVNQAAVPQAPPTVPQVNQTPRRTASQINQAPRTIPQAPRTPRRPRRTMPQVNQAPQLNQAPRTVPQVNQPSGTVPQGVPQVKQAPRHAVPQVNQAPRTVPQVNQAPPPCTVPQVNQATCDNIIRLLSQNLVSRQTTTGIGGNCNVQTAIASILGACSSATRFAVPCNPSVGSRHVLNKNTVQPHWVPPQFLGVHKSSMQKEINNWASQFVSSNIMAKQLDTAFAPSSAHSSQNQQNPASVSIGSGTNVESSSQHNMDTVVTNSETSQSLVYKQPVPPSTAQPDINQLPNQNQPF